MKPCILTTVLTVFLSLFADQNIYGQRFSWTQQIGTPTSGVGPMVFDKNNNSVAAGQFSGTTDFDSGPGTYNITAVGNFNMFLLKQNNQGGLIWAKNFAGLSANVVGIPGRLFMCNDSFGNFYLTGSFQDSVDFDPGPGVYKMASVGNFSNAVPNSFIVKLDTGGNFMWAKQLGGLGLNSASGLGIKTDPAGNVYVSTSFSGSIDADPGPNVLTLLGAGIMIHKLDSAGNFVWVKQIVQGGPAWWFDMDSSSNLYLAGQFASPTDFDPGPATVTLTPMGETDIFIEKLDSAGNYQWVRQIGGGGNDVAWSLAADGFGNVLATGYFEGTADFDPGPATYNLTSTSTRSIFTLKLRGNGDFAWATSINGPGLNEGRAIATDNVGNVYTTGAFPSSADFDAGLGTFNLSSQGSYDAFIQKLDSAGNFVWAGEVGTSGYDIPAWMGLDHASDIYLTGVLSTGGQPGSGDLNPGPGVFTVNANDNGFILKLSPEDPNGINDVDLPGVSVYPNPSTGVITYTSPALMSSVEISDVTGKIIFTGQPHKAETSINLSGKPSGVYFYTVTINDKKIRGKLLLSN